MKKIIPSNLQRELNFSVNNAEETYVYFNAKKRLL